MANEKKPKNCEVKTSSVKVGNVTVNVTSQFKSEKNLNEIMYAIINTILKEKSA